MGADRFGVFAVKEWKEASFWGGLSQDGLTWSHHVLFFKDMAWMVDDQIFYSSGVRKTPACQRCGPELQ